MLVDGLVRVRDEGLVPEGLHGGRVPLLASISTRTLSELGVTAVAGCDGGPTASKTPCPGLSRSRRFRGDPRALVVGRPR